MEAAVYVGEPPQLAARDTSTLAGAMVPEGYPEPDTFTVDVPDVPELGLVRVLS